jgi:lipopolysaccharide export system protein LptC
MKSRKLERLIVAGLAVCALSWPVWGQTTPAASKDSPTKPTEKIVKEKKDPKSAAPDEKSNSGEANASKVVKEAGQGLGSFGKLLPLGQINRDVKIPSFREGNPSSFIRAATMTRLDDQKMDMERLDIRMYGETAERDMRIMMPTATYHMETEVLSSEDRSRISRKDFDLQGDTLIFDTRSQQGKMTGHIHMIIRDADSFRQQPEKPAEAGENKTVPPKPPEKPAPSNKKK